jgi:hypothetical protein
MNVDNCDADAHIGHSCLSNLPSISSPSETLLHFHIRTQTDIEQAATIRSARFGRFKLECVCRKSIEWRGPHYGNRWRKAVQKIEMGDSAGVKVGQQRQNATCFLKDILGNCEPII